MRKTAKWFVSAAIVAGVVAAPTAAFAGEISGNGKVLPLKGVSACKYSGLEDEPLSPGTVQNWGHTKDAPIIISSKGASSVTLDFGAGPVTEGCNPHVGGEG
jgi:hypothetical protein